MRFLWDVVAAERAIYPKDVLLARAAASQHGLFTSTQAAEAGYSGSSLRRGVASGRWRRVRPGVYAFSTVGETWEQRMMAAVLWAGTGACASHRSAARLWDLDSFVEDAVDLTLCRDIRAHGVKVHRVRQLAARDVTRRKGILVTTPTRTLLDLGSVASLERVEDAVDTCLRTGLTSTSALEEALQRLGGSGCRGAGVLRGVLRDIVDHGVLHSRLERRFDQLVRRHRLPRPVRQFAVVEAGRPVPRVDAAYPDVKLAIELDGYSHHSSRASFGYDRNRRNRLVLAGWTVLTFTWDDIIRRGEAVAAEIGAALASAGRRSR